MIAAFKDFIVAIAYIFVRFSSAFTCSLADNLQSVTLLAPQSTLRPTKAQSRFSAMLVARHQLRRSPSWREEVFVVL